MALPSRFIRIQRASAGLDRERIPEARGVSLAIDFIETFAAEDVPEGLRKLRRLAAVHHFGGVNAGKKGRALVNYPARELRGLNSDDLAFVRDKLMAALDPAR